jgi:hypothetical protein
MSNLTKVVIQLRKERDEAQRKVEQLERVLAALGGLDGAQTRRSGTSKLGTKHGTMSAQARKKIAAAQRARWAKWKAARKA